MKVILSALCMVYLSSAQNDFFARYSDDGSKILFYTYRYDHRSFRDAVNSDLILMDANGGYESRITFSNHYLIWPYFMPNGKDIIFSEGLDMSSLVVFTMRFDGSQKTKIDNGGVVGSIASDGSKLTIIHFSKNRTDVYERTEGSYKKKSNINKIVFFSPDWLQYVYTNNEDEKRYLVIQKNVKDSSPQTIAEGISISQIAWSFDNQMLLYIDKVDQWNHVFKVNADGSEKAQLSKGEFNTWRPSFAPDGAYILYSATSKRSGEDAFIYRLNIKSGETVQLSGN